MENVSPALTSVQRQPLGEIESHVQSLFHEIAEQWARATGFGQRRSNISGSAFVQTLVFGFLNQPEACSTDWQQTMELQGAHVSPQAIEERMTPQAASLREHLLAEMVAMVSSDEQECKMPVLSSFNGVSLQDGTVLTLPDELREHWRGSGETGGEAGLRVQRRINWSHGKLTGPWLLRVPAPVNILGRLASKTHRCPRERSLSPIAAL